MTELAPEINARIERYLGRVEAHLADRPEEEREEILRDVERHVRDALSRRAPAGATEGDVLAVLDEMDPPGSWGSLPPSSTPEKPKPSPPPMSGRDLTVPILAAASALALLLAIAAAWISAPEAGAAPGLGLVAAALLGTAAVFVAGVRWSARTAAVPEGTGADPIGAASFVLLAVAFALLLVGIVAAVAAPAYPYSFYGKPYVEQLEIRERVSSIQGIHKAVLISAWVAASVTFLLAWILGRIAMSSSEAHAVRSGWPRARAKLAPGIGAGALLATIFVLLPALGFGLGADQMFRSSEFAQRHAGALALATITLALLVLLFGVLLRWAPGVLRAVFTPVTDRLEPRHAKGFWIAAIVVVLLGIAAIGIWSEAG